MLFLDLLYFLCDDVLIRTTRRRRIHEQDSSKTGFRIAHCESESYAIIMMCRR